MYYDLLLDAAGNAWCGLAIYNEVTLMMEFVRADLDEANVIRNAKKWIDNGLQRSNSGDIKDGDGQYSNEDGSIKNTNSLKIIYNPFAKKLDSIINHSLANMYKLPICIILP